MPNTTAACPDAGSLYQAALNHLARYAATEAGVRRVLMRQIDRWGRVQDDPDAAEPVIAAARAAVEDVIARLVRAGAVNDAAYAESRAKSLVRTGRSKRAVLAGLTAKGVASDIARAAAVDAASELAAALVVSRKRRLGPYRDAEEDAATRMKEMGVLARAGFSRDVAEQALATPREEAERRIFELRR